MSIALNNRCIPLDGSSMQCQGNWRHLCYMLCNGTRYVMLLETENMANVQMNWLCVWPQCNGLHLLLLQICYCKSSKVGKPQHVSELGGKSPKKACEPFHFGLLRNHFGKCQHLPTAVGKSPKTLKKGIVIRPILHNEMNSRCQVDLIDMQSNPDRDMKFI